MIQRHELKFLRRYRSNSFMPHAPIEMILAAVLFSSAISFLFMDANPSLWCYDKFFMTKRRLKRVFGGKTIWITGASSGIGAQLALQLSACDANLVLSARNEAKLHQVASQCTGGNVRVIPMDVDCTQEEMNEVVELVGPIDCVILNAGIGQQGLAVKTSREETERVFRVNILSPIHLTQTLLRQAKPPSHFVVTSSVVAKVPAPLSASYAASKHAVHGYFSSLALEMPELQIDLPCPGPISTSFFNEPSKTELKMGVVRCARLILGTMMVGGETWIAQQPTLIFFYLNQFLPGVTHLLLKKLLAPTRLALWDAGLNLFDPASIGKLRALKREERRMMPR
jgi:short-subunit dehydrogenase